MDVAMDSQWNHEANNFAMDNNDYEKAFESYISDVDDDGESEFQYRFWANHASFAHSLRAFDSAVFGLADQLNFSIEGVQLLVTSLALTFERILCLAFRRQFSRV